MTVFLAVCLVLVQRLRVRGYETENQQTAAIS